MSTPGGRRPSLVVSGSHPFRVEAEQSKQHRRGHHNAMANANARNLAAAHGFVRTAAGDSKQLGSALDRDRGFHRTDWEGTTMLLVHNFSSEPRSVRIEVDLPSDRDRVVDLLDQERTGALDGARLELKIEGYGYRWFRVEDGPKRGARPR